MKRKHIKSKMVNVENIRDKHGIDSRYYLRYANGSSGLGSITNMTYDKNI